MQLSPMICGNQIAILLGGTNYVVNYANDITSSANTSIFMHIQNKL